MSDLPTQFLRGEIWWINFDPTIGDEIQKTRPGVVISIGAPFEIECVWLCQLPVGRRNSLTIFWMIKLPASAANGLSKDSAANAFQLRALSEQRFLRKLGSVTGDQLEEIAIAVAICIGLQKDE